MSHTDFPEFGDAQLLPKGDVIRPSTQRQPFDNTGRLKPGGPGPLTEVRFYEHEDLASFPQWIRTRGNEWTTAPFRKIVLGWLAGFFRDRPWPRAWDVKEVAGMSRSMNRLGEDSLHLVIGITPREGERVETAIAFPPDCREDNPAAALGKLNLAASTLDEIFRVQ